jgi:hypothetical protein
MPIIIGDFERRLFGVLEVIKSRGPDFASALEELSSE